VNRSVAGSNPACGAIRRRSSAGESVRFIPVRSWVRSPPPLLRYILSDGDHGEAVNAPDCGSGIRGFDPHWSPHYNIISRTLSSADESYRLITDRSQVRILQGPPYSTEEYPSLVEGVGLENRKGCQSPRG